MKPVPSLKLTSRGRHAVTAMLTLAHNGQNGTPVPLATIAKSGNISMSYLEQMFKGLRQKNLVRSLRGPGGGYVLAKPPAAIAIADILLAAEDGIAKTAHGSVSSLTAAEAETEALWNHMGSLLKNHLQSLSLEDVMRGEPFCGK